MAVAATIQSARLLECDFSYFLLSRLASNAIIFESLSYIAIYGFKSNGQTLLANGEGDHSASTSIQPVKLEAQMPVGIPQCHSGSLLGLFWLSSIWLIGFTVGR